MEHVANQPVRDTSEATTTSRHHGSEVRNLLGRAAHPDCSTNRGLDERWTDRPRVRARVDAATPARATVSSAASSACTDLAHPTPTWTPSCSGPVRSRSSFSSRSSRYPCQRPRRPANDCLDAVCRLGVAVRSLAPQAASASAIVPGRRPLRCRSPIGLRRWLAPHTPRGPNSIDLPACNCKR